MIRAPLRRLRRAFFPTWTDHWQAVQAELGGLRGLHIGSGPDRYGDLVRLDINPAVGPDVVWNLEQFPYPFPDASFDLIVAINIVEHLRDTFAVIGELHRLLRPGGRICLLSPHFSSTSAHIDPTHVRAFSAQSFDYFVEGTDLCRQYGYYVSYRLRMARRQIGLQGWWHWVPGLVPLVSRRPGFWEDYLCYLVRGRGVYVELVKPDDA